MRSKKNWNRLFYFLFLFSLVFPKASQARLIFDGLTGQFIDDGIAEEPFYPAEDSQGSTSKAGAKYQSLDSAYRSIIKPWNEDTTRSNDIDTNHVLKSKANVNPGLDLQKQMVNGDGIPRFDASTGRFYADELPANEKMRSKAYFQARLRYFQETATGTCAYFGRQPLLLQVQDEMSAVSSLLPEKHVYLICDSDHDHNDHLYEDPNATIALPSDNLVTQLKSAKISSVVLEGYPSMSVTKSGTLTVGASEDNYTRIAFIAALIRGDSSGNKATQEKLIPGLLDVLVSTFPQEYPEKSKREIFEGLKSNLTDGLKKVVSLVSPHLSKESAQMLAANDWAKLETQRESEMLKKVEAAIAGEQPRGVAIVVGKRHCGNLQMRLGSDLAGQKVIVHTGELKNQKNESSSGSDRIADFLAFKVPLFIPENISDAQWTAWKGEK